MPHPFEALPIPRILWDSVESVLTAQVNKLAKDIAETLDKPVKSLLDAIKKDKVTAYLWEEPSQEMMELETMVCQAFTRHPENVNILCKCSQPIVWSSLSQTAKRCAEHMNIREIYVSPSLIQLKPIIIKNTQYYLRDEKEIINSSLEMVGTFNSGVARLFIKA